MVKKLIQQHNPSIVFLQETKLSSVDSLLIKSIWSFAFIGWTSLDAIDLSGGILILWSEPDFSILKVIQGHFSISIYVLLANGYSFWLIAIYGPSDNVYRADFWQELDDFAGLGGEDWANGGDFNVTWWSWEKSHDRTISSSMRAFN